tara:strand:- start:18020 stop:19675 length:1656 start_codon:yes stop_codon:yes gene_type:complete
MALGKNLATGRFDADQNAVMKVVRKPRFVDNAVRHGEYTKVKAGFAVNKPTGSDFIPTTEKRYKLIEEEDTIRLLHNPTSSVTYEGALFFDNDKVTTTSTIPALVVGADNHNQLLALSEIKDAPKGTRYGLENMKGRTLQDIGFTDKVIHFAQKVGVGLRTSDLAARVAKANTSSINGVRANSPSSTFIAQDFYGVEAFSALRYLAKHDGYSPKGDRFGNLCYLPQNHIEREYLLTESRVLGGTTDDSSETTPNRVVVRGKPRANNHNNVIQVDDFGRQETGIVEVPGGIHAPTAVTKASAKLIGQRMLKIAKNASGSRKLSDVLAVTHVHPGDMVSYKSRTDNERYVVLGTTLDLNSRISKLHVNSVDVTLEDVLQRFQEIDVSGNLNDNQERNRQFATEEFSTSFGFKVKVSYQISERVDMNRGVGYTLGMTRRNSINGSLVLESTGVFINNGGGHAIGTTSFTTDGTGANSVFTVDNQPVFTTNGNKLGHINASSVGPNTVVLKSASVHPILDNEELFILSTQAFPETRNQSLKIGMVHSSYLKTRRG